MPSSTCTHLFFSFRRNIWRTAGETEIKAVNNSNNNKNGNNLGLKFSNRIGEMQSNTHTHCARHSGAKLLQMCISYQLGRQPAVNSEQSPSTPSPALSFSAPLPRANSFVIYVRSCLLRFAQSASHCPVLVVAVALGVVFFVGVKGRAVLTYLLCTRWHFRCAISGFTVTASPTKITKITVPTQYRNIANDSHQHREGPTEAPHLAMPRPFGVIIIII